MIMYLSLTSGPVIADVVLLQTCWLHLLRVYNQAGHSADTVTLPDSATANSSVKPKPGCTDQTESSCVFFSFVMLDFLILFLCNYSCTLHKEETNIL